MKFLKLVASWQFWVSVVLAIALVFGLIKGTFLWLDKYTNHEIQIEVPDLSSLNLDEAIQKLQNSELEFELDTTKYDPKFKPYQILDVYPLAGTNVKRGRRIFIRANAKTWKPVVVPNIIGKYKYLAFNQLDLVGLKVIDTLYEPSLATNTVIRLLYKGKEVQPGVNLPRFSPLTIVLAKGLAKNVSVPNFLGLDEETAKRMITEKMFSVGTITYDDPDNKENTRVYYQVPSPSANYDQGQSIDIYLSSKPLEELRTKIRDLDATFNPNSSAGYLGETYEDEKFYRPDSNDDDIISSSNSINAGSTNIPSNTNIDKSSQMQGNSSSISDQVKENQKQLKPTADKDQKRKVNRIIVE
ncbi:PASTA domain-containing protein [Apibacter muscae]|uniref:PASTA domain-containing protein n=1 Tax=Apibacter muscae TaxID=2509004 RepID=A0A563D798_9FLAO|nr:PASTA domain-containing protein [Apibacter muscae]TWP26050.1 PASTA domain-containing protein [Apibacter muscae]TWP27901.1 PASTA domain-containing protein [Apibacter muscae]